MMDIQNEIWNKNAEGLTMNLAIVGGGRTCKSFMESLRKRSLPYLEINIVGVCDINPKAEGLLLAKKLGIYTTRDFRNFFSISGLNKLSHSR